MSTPTHKWQRESSQISKQKAKRVLLSKLRRRAFITIVLFISFNIILFSWWVFKKDLHIRVANDIKSYCLNLTAQMGFSLDKVVVLGNKDTNIAKLNSILEFSAGQALLAIPIDEIKSKIEALPEVKFVRVERIMPNKIKIDITERVASAILQKDGKHILVDSQGVELKNRAIEDNKLIVIVGDESSEHVMSLLDLLSSVMPLKQYVKSAKFVDKRRWDIEFNNGIIVKLPQVENKEAWKRLYKLHKKVNILERSIVYVDMRLRDRLFIKVKNSDSTTLGQKI